MGLDVTLLTNHCEHCDRADEVFNAGITHNLSHMAEASGVYKYLWRPEECQEVKTAKDLVRPLQVALRRLREAPEYYDKFNPPNGWGSYESFVIFITRYLDACERYPDAKIRAWR